MIIQQIRNAMVKITYGGKVFLIDPWMQEQGTGISIDACRPELVGVRCPVDALPDTPENILADVDYCLLTHLHFDHFSADHLPKEMQIIAQNQHDTEELQAMGFTNTQWFKTEQIVFGSTCIRKTAAVHGENENVLQIMGEACGYIFQAPGEKTLYVAGDTIYCPAVADVIDTYKPEVIILNCCGARVPIGRLIMDLDDVAQVCAAAPEAMIIASHLDSVNHAQFTSDDVRRFADEMQLHQVRVPASGEKITIEA